MLENICRSGAVVAKKESVESKGILKNRNYDDVQGDQFMSIFMKNAANGPSPNLAKGPQDDLLL